MRYKRSLRLLPLLAVLGACADDPTATPGRAPQTPGVLGVYEFTLTGIGTGTPRASTAAVAGPSTDLSPAGDKLMLVPVSSTSFVEGSASQGGQRYVSVTYRVRNATGAPVSNVTFIPTLSGSAANGNSAHAGQLVPTGAVELDGNTLRATEVDVLQAFHESEIADIPLPGGVQGLLPYGFVVRAGAGRTLAPATSGNDYGGEVTFAFRYPLAANGVPNPASIVFRAVAVEDTETRMTESIEEGQDSSAVRRIRERAAALGATTVTVLAGSGAVSDEVADYPGQRQICSVRTAGTADAPTTFITREAAYTRINLLRQGESPSACGAWFRGGEATVPMPGVPHTLTLVAMDRYGNVRPVSDVVALQHAGGPTFSTSGPATLANGIGTAQVTFNAAGISLVRAVGGSVQSEQAIMVGKPTVSFASEEFQAAMAGTAVPSVPAVVVRDPAGNPLPGRTVTFAVTGGGGAVTGATAITDASGVARAGSWTLGADANPNFVTATVAGASIASNPATFRTAGCANSGNAAYGITLCFTHTMTASQRAAFENAAARWQGLITADLPSVPVNQPRGFCSVVSPALNMTVDDLLIFVTVEQIDGPGGALGGAGFCVGRSQGSLPVVGRMRFDAADLEGSIAQYNLLPALVLHEMGHVLGLGTLWIPFGYLQDPSAPGALKDTWYSGAGALVGFNNIGGATYTQGKKVPLENTGGVGTLNVHWRESVFARELMTGYLGPGEAPLSEMTVRALGDVGYQVNVAGADPFFRTLTLRAEGDEELPAIELGNDILSDPVRHVDEQGRVVP
jgi:hypothetical protein